MHVSDHEEMRITVRSSPETTQLRDSRRQGFTFAEILVVIGIIAVLIGIVVVGAQNVQKSQSRTVARQQIALIASAIDRYAGFWPSWKIAGSTITQRGWPDYIPGRLFEPSANGYQIIPTFNNDLNSFVAGIGSGVIEQPNQPDTVVTGDVLGANICLTYALTAATGTGPYLQRDDAEALIKGVAQVDGTILDENLPARVGTTRARRAQALVDPWGTPYRYFWVYRDPETNPTTRAVKGFLAIETADPSDARFRFADGYVLESAGPNRKFGDVWSDQPHTPQDIDEAHDNLIHTSGAL